MTEDQTTETRGIAFEIDDQHYQIPADQLAQFEVETDDVEPFADSSVAFTWFNPAAPGSPQGHRRPGPPAPGRRPVPSAGTRPPAY